MVDILLNYIPNSIILDLAKSMYNYQQIVIYLFSSLK